MIECELYVQARFSNYEMVGVSIKFVRNTPVSPYLPYFSRQVLFSPVLVVLGQQLVYPSVRRLRVR